MKDVVDVEEPTSFLDTTYIWVVFKESVKSVMTLCDKYREMLESRISAGTTEKIPETKPTGKPVAMRHDKHTEEESNENSNHAR